MEAVVRADGNLLFEGRRLRAALGRGGIRSDKREGDGATPAGALALRRVFYRADRVGPLRAAAPCEPIAPTDGWCDDPTHADYNCYVRLPHGGRAEELWRRDSLYDIVGVLGWNDSPPQRGRGSAIFLHVARGDFSPTEGCIALPLADLQQVLADGLTLIRVVE